jgi:WD40 repeat protein
MKNGAVLVLSLMMNSLVASVLGGDPEPRVRDYATFRSGYDEQNPKEFSEGLGCVAFSPDSKLLLAAVWRAGKVRWWGRDPSTYWIEVWDVEAKKEVDRLENVTYPIAFSSDGKLFAARRGLQENRVVLFNGATRKPVDEIAGPRGRVACLAFSPDGTQLATCTSRRTDRKSETMFNECELSVWDVGTLKPGF